MKARSFVLTVIFIYIANIQRGYGVAQPPKNCDDASDIFNFAARRIGNTNDGEQHGFGDYYLPADWYYLSGYVITSTKYDCGTYYPWHRTGNLPSGNDIENLTVCNRECTAQKIIQVTKCQTAKGTDFLFYLVPLDSNNEGYCIEPFSQNDVEVPSIMFDPPTISSRVIRTSDANNLHFYCEFTPDNYPLLYTVEWLLTSGLNVARQIRKINGILYRNASDFNSITTLNEDHLKAKDFHHLGITIMCSVTAQKVPDGGYSNVINSEPKFCGIEILNKAITLDTNDDVAVKLRLTVPFGCPWVGEECFLNVPIFIPESNSCELPTYRYVNLVDPPKPCGVRISSDDINKIHEFRLKRVVGNHPGSYSRGLVLLFRTERNNLAHPLFANYTLQEVRVRVAVSTALINGKMCYSHNDPHMKTSAGIRFENQSPGKYIFYRHTQYPIEVQIWTRRVSDRVSLNCGIAVRAGRDVFVYSICGSGKEISFRICDDAVLHRRVKLHGKNYEVYLPTGTVVVIKEGSGYVNFHITPSMADVKDTDGLCGSLDNPDFVPDPVDYIVSRENDLFSSSNYGTLTSWNATQYLCSCDAEYNGSQLNDTGFCDANSKITCKNDRSNVSRLDHICAIERRKRHARGQRSAVFPPSQKHMYGSYHFDDHYMDASTAFKGPEEFNGFTEKKHIVSKRTTYDDMSARQECLAIMNTTLFQTCSNIPLLDQETFVNDCIEDAKLTGGMEWAHSHLVETQGQCLHLIEVNKPLSAEAMAELVNSLDNETVVNTTETPTFNYTEELFQELSEMICPNDCSNRGYCVEGKCVCDTGYIDVDCSLERDKPPVMSGIPDRGLCDKQLRPCQQTAVFGDGFVSSENLTCRLIQFTMNSQSIKSFTESVKVHADVLSVAEVICPIPLMSGGPLTRQQTSDGVIATGYRVSISNDGIHFGYEDELIVFDSRCVNCSKDDGRAFCQILPGYCAHNGACYIQNEETECGICIKDIADKFYWVQKEECSGTSGRTPSMLWIIPAVVGPLALLVVFLVIYRVFSSYYTERRINVYTETFDHSNTQTF